MATRDGTNHARNDRDAGQLLGVILGCQNSDPAIWGEPGESMNPRGQGPVFVEERSAFGYAQGLLKDRSVGRTACSSRLSPYRIGHEVLSQSAHARIGGWEWNPFSPGRDTDPQPLELTEKIQAFNSLDEATGKQTHPTEGRVPWHGGVHSLRIHLNSRWEVNPKRMNLV